jgi:hypothetical protein
MTGNLRSLIAAKFGEWRGFVSGTLVKLSVTSRARLLSNAIAINPWQLWDMIETHWVFNL